MINDILDEIRIAEKEAEEMMERAIEDAKLAVISADEEGRNIRNTTIRAVKEERRKVVESATKEGNTRYNKILSAGKLEADRIIKETEINKAVELIKEKILSNYGNS